MANTLEYSHNAVFRGLLYAHFHACFHASATSPLLVRRYARLIENVGLLLNLLTSAMSEFRSTPHSTLRNLCSLRHFCANKQKEAEADGTRCLKSNNKSNEIRPPPKISHSTLLYIPCKALTGVGFAARHRKCVHSFSTSDFLRPPPLHHLANSFCHLPLPGQVLRTPLYFILPPPRPSTPGNWQVEGRMRTFARPAWH